MNTVKTKEFVEQHGIVAVKADKTVRNSPETLEINELLVDLGNQAKVIPYYVIYPAGGGEPIRLEGPITQSQVLDALERAVPEQPSGDAAARTAMKPSP